MVAYSKGEIVICPHCGKSQEDPIEDFVIPGRIGIRVKYQCDWCDEKFYVVEYPSTSIAQFEVVTH